MIEQLLHPLISERFSSDAQYKERHLRVINTLPARTVLGLHIPEMKQVARRLSFEGCEIVMPDGVSKRCTNGTEVLRCFESVDSDTLNYEETIIWGFLINLDRCPLDKRLALLDCYIPILDNWAVCDTFCANAKWMARADKETLWKYLQQYFCSKKEFEARFAIVSAMTYFLNDGWIDSVFEELKKIDFDSIKSNYTTAGRVPKRAQQGTVCGEKPYYVRMGVAWLLATALAKFPEKTRGFVRSSTLPADVIRLYIRKARESFRTRTAEAL